MAELDATKDEVTELEKAVEEGQDKLRSEGEARAALEGEKERLEGEVSALQVRIDRVSTEVATLRISLQDKEAAIERLEAEGASRPDGPGADSSLAHELERKTDEVDALRQELEQQRERVGETTRALTELRELYSQAQEEVDALRSASPGARSPAQTQPAAHVDDDLRLQLSDAQTRIRQLEQDIFSLESTRLKMLKANGDLKSQVESMMEALDEERTKARAKELELVGLRDRRARSPPRGIAPSTPPSAANVPLPATPTRTPGGRSHAHRRTASVLPSVDELANPLAIDALPSLAPLASPPLISPPLVPTTGRQHLRQASLSLLKARMEDEYGVPDLDAAGPLLSPGGTGDARGGRAPRSRAVRAPLTHDLVWCSSCQGDLYVV